MTKNAIPCFLVAIASLGLPATVQAESNLIRSDGFNAVTVREWLPARNVATERVEEGNGTGEAALKVSWTDVTAFTVHAPPRSHPAQYACGHEAQLRGDERLHGSVLYGLDFKGLGLLTESACAASPIRLPI